MRTPCMSCGRLVPTGSGGRCRRPECRQPHRRYRSSAAWTAASRQARAAGRCADCGAAGVALQAHHTIALADDLAGGIAAPVVALCEACHAARHGRRARTAQDGRRRAT